MLTGSHFYSDIFTLVMGWFLYLVHNNFNHHGLLHILLDYIENIEMESQWKRKARWHFMLRSSPKTLFLLTSWETSWNNHLSRSLQRCYSFEKMIRKVAAWFPWRFSWEGLAQLGARYWSSYWIDIAEKIQYGIMWRTEQQKCLPHANSA